ncbi:Macrolide export ATP-binding/permease protein MacB [Corynebacterium glaucum]|uniref:ABC transporter permease n=2 Tax=Corynebacterium glaucum TaxID=187491 RepID=UPI0025B6218D|nr:ABC transporter permease [Corynebacterium glaucum]WJZ08114.1 Macrolide export ATP-binding/permease protein MacB [Corynebacterium glaucum]
MNIRESLRLALSSLNNNKMRSLLTLLGIIIGITAVIVITTLGRGLQNQVMSGMQGIGTTTHMVMVHERPDEEEVSDDPFAALDYAPAMDAENAMSLQDFEDLQAHFGERVEGIDIENSGGGEVLFEDTPVSTGINPVLPASLEMRGIDIEYGRGITQDDIDGQRPLAVVTWSLVDAAFGGNPQEALGSRIDVEANGQIAVFTVVGIAKDVNEGGMQMGPQSYADIYIPISGANRVGMDAEWFNFFTVRSSAEEETAVFQSDLQTYLDRLYRGNDEYTAEVLDMSDAIKELTQVFAIMTSVLSAIAGISLLVGGIGVMNIMLITVTERTREIGVRKALGATQSDIRMQFIIEAMMVCLLGGIIGVVLGGLLGMAGTAAFDAFATPPIMAVLLALFFSLAIGVFFGAYPASRAAKMEPVEALRYE